jgi:hypothetical protein
MRKLGVLNMKLASVSKNFRDGMTLGSGFRKVQTGVSYE